MRQKGIRTILKQHKMKVIYLLFVLFFWLSIDNTAAQTRTICLNGEWDFMPDYTGLIADTMVKKPVWEPKSVRVPSVWRFSNYKFEDYEPFKLWDYPNKWQRAEAGLLSREIKIDPKAGERIFLVFKGVLQRSEYFLNNQKIFSSQEAFLPIEIEVTKYIKTKGVYRLGVWTGAYKEVANNSGEMKVTAPCGSFIGTAGRGIWQDAFLEYRPLVFIENAGIKTSVRKKEIEFSVQINTPAINSENYSAAIEIFDGSKLVKSFGNDQISQVKDANGQLQLQLRQKWDNALLWSPRHPHLYQAKIILQHGKKTLDTKTICFGFREVWLEENRFMLNGIRINLKGDAWHFNGMGIQTPEYARNWYQMCFDAGVNFIRLHAMPYPDFFYDVADEMGMLIIDESAIYGSGKRMQADNPEFISNCHAHLKKLVIRDRNHPSIIIWSMQNEMRWVDGHEGYSDKMPELTATINQYDGSRPVSYDGDNRLVPYQKQQIVNFHYNIDGTINSWTKEKPIIYGELGAWHYVSPQVACNMLGQESYLSYDSCMKNLGLDMQYFIEYARKEGVTGITPFNIVHYMNRALPEHDSILHWKDVSTPGVKPDFVRKYGLEINNGLMDQKLKYIPNPSFSFIKEGFKPVTVFCNEYDHSFYGGQKILRSFCIYNDTEDEVEARLELQLFNPSHEKVSEKEYDFNQKPGERVNQQFEMEVPFVLKRENYTLEIRLFHGLKLVCEKSIAYSVFTDKLQTEPIVQNTSKLLLLTKSGQASMYSSLLPGATIAPTLTVSNLMGKNAVVVDEDMLNDSLLKSFPALLDPFINAGGRLLVLAQSGKAPGEITLSGKKFFKTFVNLPEHPVLKDLTNKDLEFWGKENYHSGDSQYLIQNAFNKPVQGNFSIILECAAGDWGHGGLLWTPLLEYKIGQGNVMLCQINLKKFMDSVPQAKLLMKNMVNYVLNDKPKSTPIKTGLISTSDTFESFFKNVGLHYQKTDKPSGEFSLIVADPASISTLNADDLRKYVEAGGKIMVPGSSPENQQAISLLANTNLNFTKNEVYQLAPSHESPLMNGVSVSDLYLFENVTYSRGDIFNTVLADYSISTGPGLSYLNSVNNPWQEYFISGNDGEPVKVGIATRKLNSTFTSLSYGKTIALGNGSLNLCQIKLNSSNPKVKRMYSRLLANMGSELKTNLLDYVKNEAEYGIPSFMYIKKESHSDFDKMITYFSNPEYKLNNLGEGIYGWMQPAELKNGEITIPGSAGNTYFLTVFIESDINRDPSQRTQYELPNDKIVPDLLLTTNSTMEILVNGKAYQDIKLADGQTKTIKIEDVPLSKGINRMALILKTGKEDLRFNLSFKDKYGDFLTKGIAYKLTLD